MGSDEQGDNEPERVGMSRRAVLKTGAVTGAAAAARRPGRPWPMRRAPRRGRPARRRDWRTSPAGDLILYNGTIHTMDGRGPWPA